MVAKHGGRIATSKAGSQDVMQALGIRIAQTMEESLKSLQQINYTYLWAPLFNRELKKYGTLRQQLGFPTIFNILGPLLNPNATEKMRHRCISKGFSIKSGGSTSNSRG